MSPTPLRLILAPEKSFYALAAIYAVAIGVLTLSIPLSVQVLISTVANTAQYGPLLILSVALLVLLAFSSVFLALQDYTLELFERRFFARISSEIVLRYVYANYGDLERVNRDEMANRYFDIMTVQKEVPILLTGGISLVLQTMVGFGVTSFYHPSFLLFNVGVVLAATLIWWALHSGAKATALSLSSAKYDMAGWLEELARANAFFKSHRSIEHALARSEELSRNYVEQKRRHFSYTFGQMVGFIALYAVASAALLGLGGSLVISGELTLGQLVAAELILSAIFVGLTRLGYYMRSYYALNAAAKKISVFFDLPLEDVRGDERLTPDSGALVVRDVRTHDRGEGLSVDLEVPSGSQVLVAASSAVLVKQFTDLLQRFCEPEAGSISIGGVDISDFDRQRLRDEILVIDSTVLLERSASDFLELADPNASRALIREVIEQVALTEVFQRIEGGLDRRLTHYGYPLSVSETMRLKLAYAILARPKLLVLGPLFDVVGRERRNLALDAIRTVPDLTLVYFSNRRDLDRFDQYVWFTSERQQYVSGLDALQEIERNEATPIGRVRPASEVGDR